MSGRFSELEYGWLSRHVPAVSSAHVAPGGIVCLGPANSAELRCTGWVWATARG